MNRKAHGFKRSLSDTISSSLGDLPYPIEYDHSSFPAGSVGRKIARESVQKIPILQKGVKISHQKRPHFFRHRLDLRYNLFASIKHGNDVFQIVAGQEIVPAASEKGFELGGKKEWGRNNTNRHPSADFGMDRMAQSRQASSVAKTKYALICRHDVHPDAVDEPATERSPFARILRETYFPQRFPQPIIIGTAPDFDDDVDIQSWSDIRGRLVSDQQSRGSAPRNADCSRRSPSRSATWRTIARLAGAVLMTSPNVF